MRIQLPGEAVSRHPCAKIVPSCGPTMKARSALQEARELPARQLQGALSSKLAGRSLWTTRPSTDVGLDDAGPHNVQVTDGDGVSELRAIAACAWAGGLYPITSVAVRVSKAVRSAAHRVPLLIAVGCVSKRIGAPAHSIALVVAPRLISERVCSSTNGISVVIAVSRISERVCAATHGIAVIIAPCLVAE